MNVYPAKFLMINEVKDDSFFDKTERDAKVRQLRQSGWKVTLHTYPLSGVYAFHAKRAR